MMKLYRSPATAGVCHCRVDCAVVFWEAEKMISVQLAVWWLLMESCNDLTCVILVLQSS